MQFAEDLTDEPHALAQCSVADLLSDQPCFRVIRRHRRRDDIDYVAHGP